MARISIEPSFSLQCDIDDFLWPWQSATPVVMLHGFSRNARFWCRWVPIVSSEHRVYRPELRGFGRSDVPPEGYRFDYDVIVSDLLMVLDQCSIERAHFVGESSGGIYSMVFALEHPERVASLVLCDTPLKPGQTGSADYNQGEATTGDAIRKLGVAEWCRRTLHHRLDPKRASPELQEWVIEEMGKTPAHVAGALNDLVRISPTLLPRVKSLQMPILLMAGDQSTVSGSQQEAFLREAPDAKFHRFSGYGHGVSLLAAEECAREALRFWKLLEKP
jgi:3-oxoadipate enol-lactonase